MDNLVTDSNIDNGQAQSSNVVEQNVNGQVEQVSNSSTWKSYLKSDLANSPLLKKFDDSHDGLNKAFESYANLEKLLGHEKVPVPKGPDDKEGWDRYSKAFKIPEKPDGYKLSEYQLPDSLKGISVDKNKFAEAVHSQKLTPSQAEGLWKIYNDLNVSTYQAAVKEQQDKVDTAINTLRQKWGDAYNTNVELGQMVINKFSDSQEMNDYITATLVSDPRGIEFLAKVGSQFAENKVGEFKNSRFTMTPDQAREEIEKIRKDSNHPYMNPKATDAEHTKAVEYVNSLYAVIARAKG